MILPTKDLFFFFPTPGISAKTPCPYYPKHIPTNGIYGEIMDGRIFSSLGYTLNLNTTSWFHEYHQEFHRSDRPNNVFYWMTGLSYSRQTNSSLFNMDVFNNLNKENYLSPFVGLELMFKAHYIIDFKFQPYANWQEDISTANLKPYGGLTFKYLIGKGTNRSGGGF